MTSRSGQFCRDDRPFYYTDADLGNQFQSNGIWTFEERWQSVAEHTDLKPDDSLLDVGCAEGLITMQAAQGVRQALGIEFQPQRIEAAQIIAKERGLTNVEFRTASVLDFTPPPLSYDVVFFLGVIQHLPPDRRIETLEKLLGATRRRLLLKGPFLRRNMNTLLAAITLAMETQNFSAIMYPNPRERGGELIVATRLKT